MYIHVRVLNELYLAFSKTILVFVVYNNNMNFSQLYIHIIDIYNNHHTFAVMRKLYGEIPK